MNCSHLSARKKRGLRFDRSRPSDTLCAELGCGSRTDFSSLASLSGTCSTSQAILQRCLSNLRHFVLWSAHELRPDKLETYSVEAVNADLRHYLKRLARRSRCFSRQIHSLLENIRLFVYCYNQRQMAKRRFPKYAFHLVDFVSLQV